MKEDVKNAVEYELYLRSKISNPMTPIGIGLMVFFAGLMAMIPIELEEDAFVCFYYIIFSFVAVDGYLRMFLWTTEDMKAVSVFSKYRMIPVKKEFLIKGKRYLFTRFVIRCTIAFQLLHLFIRVVAKSELLCIEAVMPTLIMLIIYVIELIQLRVLSRKYNR